jgi:hypothetical protein
MICLTVIAPALRAESTFDGVYTGKRVLTKGSGQLCSAEDDVSVSIKGNALTFSNSIVKTYTLGFNPNPDGSFSQISNSGGNIVEIRGRIVGDSIEADVTGLTCEHHWHLKKEHQGQ